MKLAQYIGDNFAEELQIAPRKDKTKWNTEELNSILLHNLASDMMKTFGCIGSTTTSFENQRHNAIHFQWKDTRFRGKNPKVQVGEEMKLFLCSM